MKKKTKFELNISDKKIQLFTVIILFLSLLISLLGNLEQIRQNKTMLYQNEEYTLLSKYRKDFILSSEHFLSLLGRAIDSQTDYVVVNRQLFFEDINLSENLISDEYITGDYIKNYKKINYDKIKELALIIRFTLGISSSYLKPSKQYPENFVISKKDLLASINEANFVIFKTKPNLTLKQYYELYGHNFENSKNDFYLILIDRFKN